MSIGQRKCLSWRRMDVKPPLSSKHYSEHAWACESVPLDVNCHSWLLSTLCPGNFGMKGKSFFCLLPASSIDSVSFIGKNRISPLQRIRSCFMRLAFLSQKDWVNLSRSTKPIIIATFLKWMKEKCHFCEHLFLLSTTTVTKTPLTLHLNLLSKLICSRPHKC